MIVLTDTPAIDVAILREQPLNENNDRTPDDVGGSRGVGGRQ